MQSICLISMILKEKEKLVHLTKFIKLSQMLPVSHITQTVFFTKYSVFHLCGLHSRL